MPSRTQSLANSFYSHNSILGIFCSLSCSNYNLASPPDNSASLSALKWSCFPFLHTFYCWTKRRCLLSSLSLFDHSFPEFQALTLMPSNVSSTPLCISVIYQLSWVVPRLPWTLISSWLTVFLISVTMLGSWWYHCPCGAVLVTVASALGTVCYRYELLSGLCARI